MAKKKKEEAPAVGAPAWMATFSDLMNLLLCFFVLLFSMSSVDADKYQQLVASLSNNFSIFEGGGSSVGEGTLISNGVSQLNELDDYYNDLGAASEEEKTENGDPMKALEEKQKKEQEKAVTQMYDEISELAEKEGVKDNISIDIPDNFQYVKISLSGGILFDSGQSDIKSDAIPILDKVGDILKVYSKYLIKIQGHTDNIPISGGKYKDNMQLSADRAYNVWNYFITTKKLNPKKLEPSGRGENDPVDTNKTAEGRAINRRVEIQIYNDLDK